MQLFAITFKKKTEFNCHLLPEIQPRGMYFNGAICMMACENCGAKFLNSENPKTEQLMRRAATQDDDATAELMAMHRDRLRRMVCRLDQRVSPRLDPSDVVQETMLKAVAKMTEYLKDRPIAFYPWLRQLAWDQMVDSFRKHVIAQDAVSIEKLIWIEI